MREKVRRSIHGRAFARGLMAMLLLTACSGDPSGVALTRGITASTASGTAGPQTATVIQGPWQITMTDLGFLPGGSFSSAYDINNAGEVVGVATDVGGTTRRAIWRNGVIVDTLPQASAATTTARQMNESRQFVGTAVVNSKAGYGVFWENGVAIPLQPLPGTVASGAAANGINAWGDVAGGGTGGGGGVPTYQHAGIWRHGTLHLDIGVMPGGYSSMAYDINDAGQVTGEGTAGGGPFGRLYAFVWQNGVFTKLPEIPGNYSSVGRSINASGTVAGQSNGGDPVVWTNGVLQRLTMPVRQANTVYEINDAGDVVASTTSRGVLWRNGQYIELPPWPGAAVSNSVARGINNAGVVVGESYFPPGQGVHAVMWTVTPAGNQPPVAVPLVTCVPGRRCTFDARGSTDDQGIVAYEWRNAKGALLSTQPLISKVFPSAQTVAGSLTVRDAGGLSDTKNFTFTIIP
ncbi:MAG: hypothetical protein U0132_17295 [Gemmatimonadaceae bacterium]